MVRDRRSCGKEIYIRSGQWGVIYRCSKLKLKVQWGERKGDLEWKVLYYTGHTIMVSDFITNVLCLK